LSRTMQRAIDESEARLQGGREEVERSRMPEPRMPEPMHRGVNSLTLQELVKNPNAPC
jgi:hypothetical protein